MTQILKNKTLCEECGSSLIIDRKSGKEVCRNCGLILDSTIFIKESNFFDVFFNNKNVNSFPTSNTSKDPNLFHQFNLPHAHEYYFRNKYRRMIKLQKRSNFENGSKPGLVRGLLEIKAICANLELSNQIEEEAAHYFRKFQKLNLTRGRSIVKICLCCVYLATKSRNNLFVLDEMLSKYNFVTRKELLKLSNFITEKINFTFNNNDPCLYLTQIIQNGGLPKDLLGKSIKLINQIKSLNKFQGKSPQTIAAAAIYIVAKFKKIKLTQDKIAKAAKISRKSLSQRVKEINSL